jgi:hypothetical protein
LLRGSESRSGESSQLFFETGQFLAERGHFQFQLLQTLSEGRIGSVSGIVSVNRNGSQIDVAREQVRVADFFGAGLARQGRDQRRFTLHEAVEGGKHVIELGEAIDAFGAAPEFTGSLRTAEEQDAEDGGFTAGEVKDFLEAMLVLGDAAVRAAGDRGQVLIFETMQGQAYVLFGELHDGIAIALLVAGIDESVEGERVILGSGGFFLSQGAEDAGFDGIEKDGHGERRCRELSQF